MVAYQTDGKKTVGDIQRYLSAELSGLPWIGASAYVLKGKQREREEVPPDYILAPGETLYFRQGSC